MPGALGQAEVAHRGAIRGHAVVGGHHRDRPRQLLPAELGRPGRAAQPELEHLRPDFVHRRVDFDLPVHEPRRLFVHRLEGGEHLFPRELARAGEDEVERLPSVVFEVRQRRELLGVEKFVEHELRVPIGNQRIRHLPTLAGPA